MRMRTNQKTNRFILLLFCLLLPGPVFAGWTVRSQPVKIAGGGADYFMHPRWSPDGKYIAFTGQNYSGLWLVSPDGTGLTPLTDEAAAGFGFSWSQDGTALLTRISRYEGFRRLHAVTLFDAATATARQLTDLRGRMPDLPRWTPTQERVYFFNGSTLEFADTGLKPVQRAKAATTVLPYIRYSHIEIQDSRKGTTHRISGLENERSINLEISPDFSKIAFEVVGGNLFVADIDGSNPIDLGPGFRPQWSPDGRFLAFMLSEDDGHTFTASDIYIIRADGSERTRLQFTEDRMEMDPSWSADGTKLVFHDHRNGEIYIVELEYTN